MSRRARYRDQLAYRIRQMRETVGRGCTCQYDVNAFRGQNDDCPVHGWRQDPRFAAARQEERDDRRLETELGSWR